MAPGRKRGANKAKTTKELTLGDLVLAKVKGFPAWPAKVSRPEDWERSPDPKKYFVLFFGTQEIAFVAPADIQAFNSESKCKLLTRCKGKTVKYFAQAVKEICEAFEELQKKKSGCLGIDSDQITIPCDACTIEGVEIDGCDKEMSRKIETKGETAVNNIVDVGAQMECCSHLQGETDSRDDKLMIPCEQCCVSSPFSTGKKNLSNDSDHALRAQVSMYCPSIPSNLKVDAADFENKNTFVCRERIELTRASSSSPYSGRCDVKGDSNHVLEGGKRGNFTSLETFHGKIRGGRGRRKVLTDSHKMEERDIESKRKFDVAFSSIDEIESGDHEKDEKPSKIASGGITRKSPSDAQGSLPCPGGKLSKNSLKDKKQVDISKKSQKNSFANSEDHAEMDRLGQKRIGQLGHEKRNLGNDRSHPAKRHKHAELVNDSDQGSILKNGRNDVSASNVTDRKSDKNSEFKGFGEVKVKVKSGTKTRKSKFESETPCNKVALPLVKHHRQESEVTSDPNGSTFEGEKNLISAVCKNGLSKKRRTIRLFDDDHDDEEPKTPVQGVFTRKVNASVVPDSMKSVNGNHEFSNHDGPCLKGSGGVGNSSPKECLLSADSHSGSSSPATLLQNMETSKETYFPRIAMELDENEQVFKEIKTTVISPKRYPQVVAADKFVEEHKASSHLGSLTGTSHVVAAASKVVEERKASRILVKGSGAGTQNMAQAMSGKFSNTVSDRLNSCQSQISIKKSRQLSSRERCTPKTNSLFTESAALAENQKEYDSTVGTVGGRLEDIQKEKISSLVDDKATDSVMSIKHLIAAARHAQMQNLLHVNVNSILAPSANIQGKSPCHSWRNLVSPSGYAYQFASPNQFDTEDPEERRLGSGHQGDRGSLSGGTEATIARDAFEGMIETLSRTKESIGRATRLAIDCAKYGIASEVVDLLIRKLEIEPSLHRRVDLLFLLDSITQCSTSQKGIAGASYVPAVQAALPRLLGAAAPPGATARENRRQCLKVLRLWLERKIFPESVLRCYMDNIGGSNDYSNTGISLRRSSRTERAVDDPIREMEGMLVDEYGSNVSFQLPGFLSSHAFDDDEEDEEAVPSTTCMGAGNSSPMEPAHKSEEFETGRVTPNDRRHDVLEDVDGELEMDDVSGQQKDERALSTSGSGIDLQEQHLERELGPSTQHLAEALLLEGSPPLPLEQPPPLPPLPSSPLPPFPPPLSHAVPSPPPPPPPPPPSQPPMYSMLTSGPSQSGHLPPSLPPQGPQSLFPSHVLPQHPASLHSTTSQLAYQMPVPHEYRSMSNGFERAQMVGNLLRPSTCFVPDGIAGAQDPAVYNYSRPLENGHNDMHMSSGASQPNQRFQPGHTPFIHGPFHQGPLPQTSASHFPYNEHWQCPYPRPSSPSLPDRQTPFVADEHWRGSGEYKADNQRGPWMNGGRTPSYSTIPFGGEGYFRHAAERLPANNVEYQHTVLNTSAGAPASVHVNNQMLPSRSDMPALNCWRPS